MRTIGRRALTASKEIAVSAWYVQMLIKYSIQLWIFLLRSPDFGIVAGLAILVLLCASLPYMIIQTGGLSINCIYVLSVYPTLTFFISLDFILCGTAFGVNFFIVCRLKICINISNLVLTNCNSCCMISNVSGRHDRHNNLCASGSVGGARPCQGRGRGFESRLALSFNKKDIRWMSFFVKSSPAGPGRSRSTLRSGRRRAEAKIIFPPKELIVSVLHSCFSFISS